MHTSKLQPVGPADHLSLQHPKYKMKHGAVTPTLLKGLKKVLSSIPGPVDFHAGQVTL